MFVRTSVLQHLRLLNTGHTKCNCALYVQIRHNKLPILLLITDYADYSNRMSKVGNARGAFFRLLFKHALMLGQHDKINNRKSILLKKVGFITLQEKKLIQCLTS